MYICLICSCIHIEISQSYWNMFIYKKPLKKQKRRRRRVLLSIGILYKKHMVSLLNVICSCWCCTTRFEVFLYFILFYYVSWRIYFSFLFYNKSWVFLLLVSDIYVLSPFFFFLDKSFFYFLFQMSFVSTCLWRFEVFF